MCVCVNALGPGGTPPSALFLILLGPVSLLSSLSVPHRRRSSQTREPNHLSKLVSAGRLLPSFQGSQ